MGLSCPGASLVPRIAKHAAPSSATPNAIGQCALTELDSPTMTIIEGGMSGTASTLDFGTSIPFASTDGQFTYNGNPAASAHCQFSGTTGAVCTFSDTGALTEIGPSPVFTTTTNFGGGPSDPAVTTTLGTTDVAWMEIVVTAGQQKFLSASSTSSPASTSATNGASSSSGGAPSSSGGKSSGGTSATSKAAPSPTSSAPPKSTSNVAGDNTVGVGMTGAILAGAMGFFMAV
ncbi:MAG: hypothetical protein Q9165_002323 [Trypethelium subeluteriae]